MIMKYRHDEYGDMILVLCTFNCYVETAAPETHYYPGGRHPDANVSPQFWSRISVRQKV
jgi:hypothetical protein